MSDEKATSADIWLFIARDFSETPGPRTRPEGDHSGQAFLEDCLLPKFEEARSRGVHLFVDMDGTEGYATSFLEEAFGGLARRYTPSQVLEIVRFKSIDQADLPEDIRTYIGEADQ